MNVRMVELTKNLFGCSLRGFKRGTKRKLLFTTFIWLSFLSLPSVKAQINRCYVQDVGSVDPMISENVNLNDHTPVETRHIQLDVRAWKYGVQPYEKTAQGWADLIDDVNDIFEPAKIQFNFSTADYYELGVDTSDYEECDNIKPFNYNYAGDRITICTAWQLIWLLDEQGERSGFFEEGTVKEIFGRVIHLSTGFNLSAEDVAYYLAQTLGLYDIRETHFGETEGDLLSDTNPTNTNNLMYYGTQISNQQIQRMHWALTTRPKLIDLIEVERKFANIISSSSAGGFLYYDQESVASSTSNTHTLLQGNSYQVGSKEISISPGGIPHKLNQWNADPSDYLISNQRTVDWADGQVISYYAYYEQISDISITVNEPVEIKIYDPWYIENASDPDPKNWHNSDGFISFNDLAPTGQYKAFINENINFDETNPIYQISVPRYYADENGIYEFDSWSSNYDGTQAKATFAEPSSHKTAVIFKTVGAEVTANYDKNLAVNLIGNQISIETDDVLKIPEGANFSIADGFSIEVAGTVEMEGTQENKITINSSSFVNDFNDDYEQSVAGRKPSFLSIAGTETGQSIVNIENTIFSGAYSTIFLDGATNVLLDLDNVVFEGNNLAFGSNQLINSSVNIQNCQFVGGDVGFSFGTGLAEYSQSSSITVTNTSFSNHQEHAVWGIFEPAWIPSGSTNLNMNFNNCTFYSTTQQDIAENHYTGALGNMSFSFDNSIFVNTDISLNVGFISGAHNLQYQSDLGQEVVATGLSDLDQIFINPANEDYRLVAMNSDGIMNPAIDAGTPGLTDPDPMSSPLDIGAYHCPQTTPSTQTTILADTEWYGIYYLGDELFVAVGKTLTIIPGSALKFSNDGVFHVSGNLVADGTAEAPITFTSSEANPAKSDWNGIQIISTSDDNITILDNCIVEYAHYGIRLNGTSPEISNNFVSDNYYGLYCSTSNSNITSNEFLNNGYGARTQYASPHFVNNVFRNNSYRGIYSYGTSIPRFDNNTIEGNDIGLYAYNHADPQFGNRSLNDRGYNEIINNDIYGIYASYYSDPFLGASGPYDSPISGYNSIHSNGLSDPDVWGNVAAHSYSVVKAEHNWWGSYPPSSSTFKTSSGGSVDYLPALSSTPSASSLGSTLAKGAAGSSIVGGGDQDDCPEYDFFNPDTNSECGLWHWAEDLRITKQIPVALYAWRKYVEKFPYTDNAAKALVKIVNYSSEKELTEVIDYLNQVMKKYAKHKTLKIKALELLVSEQSIQGDHAGAIGQATKLLAQAQNEDQEKIALYALVDLHVSGLKNESAAQNYLDMLKNRFPSDELTMFAAEIMGEEPNWALVKPAVPEEEEAVNLPEKFALYKAYPNPFNPITHIRYDLSEASQVVLNIYDIKGRLVKTLTEGHQNPGYYEVQWNGSGENENALPSGLYIYRLQAGKYTANEKMLLLK